MVVKHCLHDEGLKLRMHALVVMPDHVHLIFTPMTDPLGKPYGLSEILGGIKGASAHTINKHLKRRGPVWQDESFDHILRREEKLEEKVEYVRQNPVRKGLVKAPEEYPYTWVEWRDLPAEGHSRGRLCHMQESKKQVKSRGRLWSLLLLWHSRPRLWLLLIRRQAPSTAGPNRSRNLPCSIPAAAPAISWWPRSGCSCRCGCTMNDCRLETPAMPCSAKTCSASRSILAARRSPHSPWPWPRGPTPDPTGNRWDIAPCRT